jgi:hypothetical protein
MIKYKLVANKYTGTPTTVIDLEGGWCIPFDETNTDYQAYLKWVDQGGITEPADE